MKKIYEMKRWFSETGTAYSFRGAMPCYVEAENEKQAIEIAKNTKQIKSAKFTNFEINEYSTFIINSNIEDFDINDLLSFE